MTAAIPRRDNQHGDRRSQRCAGLATLALVLACAGPCRADDETRWRFPTVDDTTAIDGQTYSYYYVPHLSELNQLVGYLFRSGLIRKDAPDREAAITRYAAYSCEGTMYVGASPGPGAAEDVDWSRVTALHAGPATDPPSLIVERAPQAGDAAKPLVLYVPDPTIRYQLHQALAVLVSECRPRGDRAR